MTFSRESINQWRSALTPAGDQRCIHFVYVTAGPLPSGLASLHQLFDLELHNNYFTKLPNDFSGDKPIVQYVYAVSAMAPWAKGRARPIGS